MSQAAPFSGDRPREGRRGRERGPIIPEEVHPQAWAQRAILSGSDQETLKNGPKKPCFLVARVCAHACGFGARETLRA